MICEGFQSIDKADIVLPSELDPFSKLVVEAIFFQREGFGMVILQRSNGRRKREGDLDIVIQGGPVVPEADRADDCAPPARAGCAGCA